MTTFTSSRAERAVAAHVSDRPQRRSDVQARGLAGETLVLDRDGGLIHQLNETASFIWTRCTGDHSVVDIARDLADAFDVEPETATRDVETTLAQLRTLKLVDTDACMRGASTA
jgi:coenzyme PQQ synthesis protein D (PqqD)